MWESSFEGRWYSSCIHIDSALSANTADDDLGGGYTSSVIKLPLTDNASLDFRLGGVCALAFAKAKLVADAFVVWNDYAGIREVSRQVAEGGHHDGKFRSDFEAAEIVLHADAELRIALIQRAEAYAKAG